MMNYRARPRMPLLSLDRNSPSWRTKKVKEGDGNFSSASTNIASSSFFSRDAAPHLHNTARSSQWEGRPARASFVSLLRSSVSLCGNKSVCLCPRVPPTAENKSEFWRPFVRSLWGQRKKHASSSSGERRPRAIFSRTCASFCARGLRRPMAMPSLPRPRAPAPTERSRVRGDSEHTHARGPRMYTTRCGQEVSSGSRGATRCAKVSVIADLPRQPYVFRLLMMIMFSRHLFRIGCL